MDWVRFYRVRKYRRALWASPQEYGSMDKGPYTGVDVYDIHRSNNIVSSSDFSCSVIRKSPLLEKALGGVDNLYYMRKPNKRHRFEFIRHVFRQAGYNVVML